MRHCENYSQITSKRGSRMFTTYIVATVLAAVINAFSATLALIRYKTILVRLANARIPESWLPTLGLLKAAGAIGLLVGIGLPLVGTLAGIGLILYFIGAILTHIRARDNAFGLASAFLLIVVLSFVLDVLARGASAWTFI
jgi:DoxX-like family